MKKTPQDFFNELIKIGAVKINPYGSDRGPSVNLGATTHEIEAEKIEAIKQKNSRGLFIFDINPNEVPRDGFECVYDGPTLLRVFGQEFNSELTGRFLDADQTSNAYKVNPYWRTVVIDKPGNWVKIEVLPPRENWDGFSPANVTPQNPVQDEPQNTDYYTAQGEVEPDLVQASGSRVIFLDFENPTLAPHLIKSGDEFSTYFSSLVLTFKQFGPRIRVTIGYNSKVTSREEKTQALHLGRGLGFLENQSSDPVPFCVSDRDYSNSSIAGFNVASGTFYAPIFINPPYLGKSDILGLDVLWLTEFLGQTYNTTTPSAGSLDITDVEIVQGFIDPTSATFQPAQVTRRLCGFTSVITGNDTVGNTGNPSNPGNVIVEPKRVSLRPGEGLWIRWSQVFKIGTRTVLLKWNLSGYGFGPFSFGLLTQDAPFQFGKKFMEHPYPFDSGTYEAPRR